MLRRDPLLIVAVVMFVTCVATALVLERSVWAAACGSGVVVAMWAVEKATVRRGSEGSFGHGVAIGVGGMMVRVALVIGVLGVVAVAASREAAIDATLAWAASYTIYNIARLWWHPAVPAGR